MRKYLLSIAMLLVVSPAQCLTRGEIRTQVRWLVGDTEVSTTTNKQRWTDDIINARINIVQEEIARQTRCSYGRALSTPTAGIQEVLLPSDVLNIDRVTFISISGSTVAYRKLEGVTMPGLDRDNPTWESLPAGIPRYYYIRGQYIGLVPAPSSTYAVSKALKIDYYKKPAALTTDSCEPFDGDYALSAYHDLLIKGVVIMCRKDNGQDASALIQEYYALIKQMGDEIRTRPDIQEIIKTR